MACTPFSLTLAVLATDNMRQFSFSINKGCISEDKPFYVLNFIFRDRSVVTDNFQDRVRLEVTLGETDNPKAEKLMTRGLTNAQLTYLKGPLTKVVSNLPPGTSNDANAKKAGAEIVNTKPALPV